MFTHLAGNRPLRVVKRSVLDTDRDGLNLQAAPIEGRGDGACAALVAQDDLIGKSNSDQCYFLFP
jgi:hypothetical protein